MPAATPCMPAMGDRYRNDRVSRDRKSDSNVNVGGEDDDRVSNLYKFNAEKNR